LHFLLTFCVGLLVCGCALADTNPADYPLKITVLEPALATSGRANVDDGQSVHGIDFDYTCNLKVEALPEGQYYRAQWIKAPAELRLLVARPGKPAVECDLKTTLHDEVYVAKDGKLTLVTQQELKQWKAEEDFARHEITDLSGYPVKLLVANQSATFIPTRFLGLPAGRFSGWGQGDTFEYRSVHGVDFTFECVGEIPAGRTYAAKWIDPENQLEVLVPVPGQENQYYSCKAATALKDYVYVKSRRGASLPGSQKQT
jgi:hypothetical protein